MVHCHDLSASVVVRLSESENLMMAKQCLVPRGEPSLGCVLCHGWALSMFSMMSNHFDDVHVHV